MATSTTAEQTIDVVTPAAGESVTEGTILEWHAKVGDPIKLDDTIVEISTDKVDVELPSPASGTVSEILAQEGDTVTVGQVIARIAVGERAQNGALRRATARLVATLERRNGSDGAHSDGGRRVDPAPPARRSCSADAGGLPDGVKASPVAARAAAVEGVDLGERLAAAARPGRSGRPTCSPPPPATAPPGDGRATADGTADGRRAQSG